DTPTTPEIDVQGNNIDIANNDTTPSTTDGTDMGVISPEPPAPIQTYVIKNVGGANLNVSTVSVPTGFTLISAPPATTTAGGSASFQIHLSRTATNGTFSGVVSFTNNDDDNGDGIESPFSFTISATVAPPPTIVVSGGSSDIANGDTTPSTTDGTDFGA